MKISRRQALALGIAAPALLRFGSARAGTALKISHQFPGGTATEGVVDSLNAALKVTEFALYRICHPRNGRGYSLSGMTEG